MLLLPCASAPFSRTTVTYLPFLLAVVAGDGKVSPLSGGTGHLQPYRFPSELATLDKGNHHLCYCCLLQDGQCFAVAKCHIDMNGFHGDELTPQSLGGPAECHCRHKGQGWMMWLGQRGCIAPLGSAGRPDELSPIVILCRWGLGLPQP